MIMRKKTFKKLLNDILGRKVDEIPALIDETRKLIGPAGDVGELKKEIAELKLQKTMEEREIKHLVTLKQEKLDIEHQKKELTLQADFNKKEMALQAGYHDKIHTQLKEFNVRQDKFFENVMERLPKVTVHQGGPVNEKKE